MFSVNDFLDRAKKGAGVESDYALAKIVGVSRANVSNWRNERNAPDERAIVKLCDLSGDDPEYVALLIQSMRAANDDAAGLWRRAAERLKKGAAAVALWPAVALIFGALITDRAEAAATSPALDLAGVCVLCQIVIRLLMRLAVRRRRQANYLPCNHAVTG
jgi:transcriptional regulator with XRE-family HTH domain